MLVESSSPPSLAQSCCVHACKGGRKGVVSTKKNQACLICSLCFVKIVLLIKNCNEHVTCGACVNDHGQQWLSFYFSFSFRFRRSTRVCYDLQILHRSWHVVFQVLQVISYSALSELLARLSKCPNFQLKCKAHYCR